MIDHTTFPDSYKPRLTIGIADVEGYDEPQLLVRLEVGSELTYREIEFFASIKEAFEIDTHLHRLLAKLVP